jgi:hypothetical protein
LPDFRAQNKNYKKEKKMRAYFKNMIQAYRGKCDGLVYYYNPRLNRIVVRPHVKPRPSEQTRRFGAIATNLKALNPSQGFKTDLSVYVDVYNRKASNHRHPMNNWYNAFNKMMYALAKKYPAVEQLSKAADLPEEQDAVPAVEKLDNNRRFSSNGVLLYVDLSTITREFIYENDLPCISVKRAVEAGLLTPVNGYELLTQEM